MHIKNKINHETLRQINKVTKGQLTLGKLMLAIRKCENLTQVEFAKKLGCSKQHLCDVEHDRKNISSKMAASYAKTLGYSLEQFVRLALQNIINRDGLKMIVDIKLINTDND
jgi:transcriptional regulator with XRE-family HTH domain